MIRTPRGYCIRGINFIRDNKNIRYANTILRRWNEYKKDLSNSDGNEDNLIIEDRLVLHNTKQGELPEQVITMIYDKDVILLPMFLFISTASQDLLLLLQ